jgi:indole-3-glycerol phosphate synthase
MVAATREALRDPEYLTGLPAMPFRTPPALRPALADPAGAIVAEYKRRSPGAARPDLPDRSLEEFCTRTASAPIAGYSCLASRPEFGGSPGDVAELATRTARPILFKDFIVDPLQLEAASRSGASAVLLIARLEVEGLLDLSLRDLAERAHARKLEVVLEWHQRSELRHTDGVPADVYGVNVRDLDTLEIHRNVAEETIRAATDYRPLLGMSGVEGPSEARRFWTAGVDGILVGSALARAGDPAAFLAGLQRPRAGGRA